jgi:hypothetical protein
MGLIGRLNEVNLSRTARPGQIPGAKISVCQGVGGMFAPPALSSCRMSRRNRWESLTAALST